jgi:polysaccharide biosynthesis/export protein
MLMSWPPKQVLSLLVVWGVCLVGAGCTARQTRLESTENALPKELAKVSLPPYVIETPDILSIDALRVVPKPPYRIEPLDALVIQVNNTPEREPIAGLYFIEPEGTVNLGFAYGSVRLAGMTLDQARAAVEKHLKRILKNPIVTVALGQSRAMQQIRGEHLVRPDGTVSLGLYGSVYVNGMTVPQAKAVIESHLAQFLLQPEIALDVLGYNSKVYYVIIDLAGAGQQLVRFPLTGNETVLDAMSQLSGLPPAASKKHIWVARPAPAETHCEQILPVNWGAITKGGSTATNYQLLPGDRLYVQGDALITLDTTLAKIISPMERLFGIALLGDTTIQTLRRGGGGIGGTGTGVGR